MTLLILLDTDGGAVAPPGLNILDINVYSKNLIHVLFDDEVVVDGLYTDPDNYTLTPSTGTVPLSVLGVLQTNKTSSLELLLVTWPMTPGTTYTLDIASVVSRAGFSSAFSSAFEARVTKLDSILNSIPGHFDKRPSSLIYSLLTAVAVSDDLIGGSRSDSFTYI